MSEKVRKMFGDISSRYDFMNNLLSFGVHKSWRRKTVKLSAAKAGYAVLDCACGTADLAIEFSKIVGNGGKVVATDFCDEMLELAEQKAAKKQLHIQIKKEDVMNLSFEDNSFDIVSIAFGIRNVDSTSNCLKEMARVVKPGGKVIVLEFGQPYGPISPLYNLYSKHLFSFVGKLLAGSAAAYDYLQDTAAKFPCRSEFLDIMQRLEIFDQTYYTPLTMGIAYVYIGRKKNQTHSQ